MELLVSLMQILPKSFYINRLNHIHPTRARTLSSCLSGRTLKMMRLWHLCNHFLKVLQFLCKIILLAFLVGMELKRTQSRPVNVNLTQVTL